MKIKILSDSTCDLPQALVDKYNIGIVPLIVMKDDQEFLDGVTITPADIFAHVAAGGKLCSTAARSLIVYQELFETYAKEYDGIVHISLGSSFSSCYQNACLAADEFDNVRVVDSQNLTTGQGLIVLKACELSESAASLDELKEALDAYAAKVESSFVVDKLDYLAKGGRCSSATALGANVLNLKPCIDLKDGKMGVGKKYRGNFAKCLVNYIKERLEDREDIDWSTVFVTYTDISDEVHTAIVDAVRTYGKFENVLEATAGCTVSCHCGPGTMGVIFVRK